MLDSHVLAAHHHVMVDAVASFFYDPSVVPLCFAIYATLAVVGAIIRTM